MAAFGIKKGIFGTQSVAPVIPAENTQKKTEYYYRFYSNKDELFWAFIYKPSVFCLELTCKMLKLPNYKEIDAYEFQQGYNHH